MKKILITLIVLMSVVAFSGCIQSDTASLNGLTSSINDNLKNGDTYFNNAASDLNKYSYGSAVTNCNNALSKFNSAKASAQQGLTHAQNSKDDVLIKYMELSISEIDARVNATLELQQAINFLQVNDTVNGNPHLTSANNFMDASMGYKAKKDGIINQNPSKFK
ncbi:MAG: hypothetical protein ACXVHU_05880 [Methanobacterium sp.]